MIAYALVMTAAAWGLGKAIEEREEVEVPEPEFKPFRFPKEEVAVKASELKAANVSARPATLAELGIERSLARDIELTLGLMGAVRGGRVVGYTFRTVDGAVHELRVSTEEKAKEVRAA